MTQAKITLTAEDRTAGAFASASRRMQGLGAEVPNLVGKLGGIGAAISAGLGALETINVINVLDQLDDLAEKSGISARQLSELRFAGEVTGTSLESLATGIGQLGKRLDDAARGGKENAALFAQLGIAVRDNAGNVREANDVLQELANVFTTLPDGTEKAALAQRLFGRSGLELIPILNQGSDGIKRLREEGERMGVVYGNDLAKAAATFNDNLVRLRFVSEGAAATLAGPLLGVLNDITAAFLGIAGPAETATQKIGPLRTAFEALAIFGANVSFVLKATGRELGAIAAQAVALSTLDIRGFNAIGDAVREDAAKARRELDAFEQRVLQTGRLSLPDLGQTDRSELARRGRRVPGFGSSAAAGAPSAAGTTRTRAAESPFVGPLVPASLTDALKRLEDVDSRKVADLNAQLRELFSLRAAQGGGAVDEAIIAVEEALQALNGVDPAVLERQARLNELLGATPSAALQQSRDDMRLLAEALERGTISADQFREAVTTRLDLVPEKFEEITADLDQFAISAARNIQTTLGENISSALSGDFENIGQAWRKLLADMAAQALAAKIAKDLFGDFGNTGSISGAVGGLLGLFGGGRARGGPVDRGRVYEVNEGGRPELLNMGGRQYLMAPQAGQVQPLGAGGGGDHLVINNHVSGGLQRQEVLGLLQQAMAATEGSIMSRLKMQRVTT